jgi:dihydropteroate synthase
MAQETTASRDFRNFSSPGAAPRADLLRNLLARRRPLVMGVLNVTPDSFSDGGRFLDPATAIAQAQRLAAEGADIIDIGAESTRPYGNATAVPLHEERARLADILPAVVALGVPVSIDTLKAPVAAWALEAGATIVNDVWGLRHDPDMARTVAAHNAPVIIMHNRDAADPSIAGIPRDRIVLDPGIGFGKTPEQSLACIAKLHEWRGFDLPLLVGASRKRFINAIVPSEPMDRLGGSLAAHLLAVENGAAIVRTHDVAATVQALAVAAAIRHAR